MRRTRVPGFALLLLFLSSGIVRAQTPPPPPPSPLEAAPATDVVPPPPPPPAEALDPPSPVEPHDHEHGSHAPHAAQTPKRVHAPAPDQGEHDSTLPDDSAHATPREVFSLPFMQHALLAGLIVGGVCAFLGVFVVLKRIVFVGVALAEMSSAGVALALLTGMEPMLGAVAVMLAGVGLISVRWAPRKVRQDAFIGVGYVVASAAAILLIAKSPKGEGHLLDLLFGSILTVSGEDVRNAAIALGCVVLIHALFSKELLFVSFDPDTAAAAGYHTRFWEALLYITVGLTIAFAIHAVGVLLTFASLVIPAITALLLTRRMNRAVAVSVVMGILPVPIGLYLSFIWDMPSAATIVVLAFVLLVIGGLVSRLRSA